VNKWKNKHPRPSQDSHIFVKINKGESISYSTVNASIKRARSHCKVDRKTNPHAFRKGRATYLAKHGWNAAQLCKYFGWSDFDTARHYIRLAKNDLDYAFRKLHSMKIQKKEEYQRIQAA